MLKTNDVFKLCSSPINRTEFLLGRFWRRDVAPIMKFGRELNYAESIFKPYSLTTCTELQRNK